MESKSVYSEPGKPVNDGNIIILTEKKSGYNLITLTRNYGEDGYNLECEGNEELKTITKSSTSYKLSILNEGEIDDKTVLNILLG
jgi:hypothetical protein